MKPRRIQLKRKKGWKMPGHTVSVARPAKWANPYAWWARGGHASATEMFREYILRRPHLIEASKHELRGKNLACWCPLNMPCHADLLLTLANARHAVPVSGRTLPLTRKVKVPGSKQNTITRSKLARLAICNSKKLPLAVNDRGVRKEWVGIGWLEIVRLLGDEVLVID